MDGNAYYEVGGALYWTLISRDVGRSAAFFPGLFSHASVGIFVRLRLWSRGRTELSLGICDHRQFWSGEREFLGDVARSAMDLAMFSLSLFSGRLCSPVMVCAAWGVLPRVGCSLHTGLSTDLL